MSTLTFLILAMTLLMLTAGTAAQQVVVVCPSGSPRLDFGIQRLEESLGAAGQSLARRVMIPPDGGADIVVLPGGQDIRVDGAAYKQPSGAAAPLAAEGYRIDRLAVGGRPAIRISSIDHTGAMYGLLDLAEQVRAGTALADVKDKLANPRIAFRAVKFNLPWMSYRRHESLQLHMETCRNLEFWRHFLDMMAENRFNALTLWNLHPFTFMIRPKNFPEACPFDDAELGDWQAFWKKLFAMAKDRGIETYIINWNIFVSPEFARAHNVATCSIDWSIGGEGDTSELVKRYTRECVTQVIDEYDDLTGLGITLGERMGGMTPQEREDWLVETFGAGMDAAKRRVKFIHRAPLSADKGSGGSTDESTPHITRRGIDAMRSAAPMLVEMKFNWSHGHSSPRLSIIHGGKASEAYWNPKPTNYQIAWTIRNEDFFILRWGAPDFIRRHIASNAHDYVGGYLIGSECYIPAANYIDPPDLPQRRAYAFQRQWLFYSLWGRLLYDPSTPDSVFAAAFDRRYGKGVGADLLAACQAASQMPLRLASFFRSTWDFTLYSEGFAAPATVKGGFITIDALMRSQTLDPTYVSVMEYVEAMDARRALDPTRITPLALADQLETDAQSALARLERHAGKSPALDHEIADVRAWAHLSLYFADKLRAAVALQTFRSTKDAAQQKRAVELLTTAAGHWDNLIAITSPLYGPVPVIHLGSTPFSWAMYRDAVQRDIEIAAAP